MNRQGWTITYEGATYRESDLTLASAAKAIDLCGGTWAELHPLTSPAHFIAVLAALIESRDGTPFNEAVLKAASLNMVKALDMLTPGETPADDIVH